MLELVVEKKLVTRGTSNSNTRGGSDARRRRREWLVMTFRADVDVFVYSDGSCSNYEYAVSFNPDLRKHPPVPACRCYRCGTLLTIDTVSADKVIPSCCGGTYRRNNIRPACVSCNSITGGGLRSK